MFDVDPGAPSSPDTPPAAPERGSGRHRADTVQIPAVPAAGAAAEAPSRDS